MAEIRTPLIPYLVDRTCDKCPKGRMRPLGQEFLTHPPKYPHACTECGSKETYKETYPYTAYDKNEPESIKYAWIAIDSYGHPMLVFTKPDDLHAFIKREMSCDKTHLNAIHRFATNSTEVHHEETWDVDDYIEEFINI